MKCIWISIPLMGQVVILSLVSGGSGVPLLARARGSVGSRHCVCLGQTPCGLLQGFRACFFLLVLLVLLLLGPVVRCQERSRRELLSLLQANSTQRQ